MNTLKSPCLLLIDLQNDYFPGGAYPLHESSHAVENAARLLAACRRAGIPVVHVRHVSRHPGATFFLPGTAGADIHPAVLPIDGEPVIVKHLVSSFTLTPLSKTLRRLGVETLLICGMQTNVCAASAVRDSAKKGYRVLLVRDAVAAVDESTHIAAMETLEASAVEALSTEEAAARIAQDRNR